MSSCLKAITACASCDVPCRGELILVSALPATLTSFRLSVQPRIVTTEWVTESFKEGTRLDEESELEHRTFCITRANVCKGLLRYNTLNRCSCCDRRFHVTFFYSVMIPHFEFPLVRPSMLILLLSPFQLGKRRIRAAFPPMIASAVFLSPLKTEFTASVLSLTLNHSSSLSSSGGKNG